MKKPRLLWVGDACVSTGFARATHYTLKTLVKYWDIVVLGINAPGDPTNNYPYPIFPAWPGGDQYGLGRIAELCRAIKPDVIVLQNDPWNIECYHEVLEEAGLAHIPVVASLAVDGKNCQGDNLNKLRLALFWTEFGREEAIKGGCRVPTGVIPLGVDREIYRPLKKSECRGFLELNNSKIKSLDDIFIVGNVNRNQPRKRLDLTVEIFAEWLRLEGPEDAYLFLHVAPTGDKGYNIRRLAKYYGIRERLILREPEIGYGAQEHEVNITYNMFDVMMSTTQGEGMGLTTLESMAAKIPNAVPNWSALGDWPGNSVALVPCSTHAATFGGDIDVIGGVVDVQPFVNTLQQLYADREYRVELGELGFLKACEPQFSWPVVGEMFHKALCEALELQEEVA